MKKFMRFFAFAALAIGMVMATSCSKDDNDSEGGGGGGSTTVTSLNGLTFQGVLTDSDYADQGVTFDLDFTLVGTSDTRMSYVLDVYQNGDYLGSDEDNITYTFNNNTGTLTFDADGYSTDFSYDPVAKTMTFEIYYNFGASVGGTAVLNQK